MKEGEIFLSCKQAREDLRFQKMIMKRQLLTFQDKECNYFIDLLNDPSNDNSWLINQAFLFCDLLNKLSEDKYMNPCLEDVDIETWLKRLLLKIIREAIIEENSRTIQNQKIINILKSVKDTRLLIEVSFDKDQQLKKIALWYEKKIFNTLKKECKWLNEKKKKRGKMN